jgi:membrane-associated protein
MIRALLEFIHTLTTPEKLIQLLSTTITGWWGYLLLFGIIFSETGLLVGFFLPGDSFLFTVGVVAGAGQLNIWLINLLLVVGAVVGNANGYMLGRRAGPHIFNRPSSRFFNKEHLERTHAFYEKHGGKTIIYAEFVPIIRTFAPFVAGVARMSYVKFAAFNLIGSIVWVTSMLWLGNFLGSIPLVRHHFEKVVILIILISVMPIVVQYFREKRKKAYC